MQRPAETAVSMLTFVDERRCAAKGSQPSAAKPSANRSAMAFVTPSRFRDVQIPKLAIMMRAPQNWMAAVILILVQDVPIPMDAIMTLPPPLTMVPVTTFHASHSVAPIPRPAIMMKTRIMRMDRVSS